jgi:hypothetical protein
MIGVKEIEKVYERLNSIDHVVMANPMSSEFKSIMTGESKRLFKPPPTAASGGRRQTSVPNGGNNRIRASAGDFPDQETFHLTHLIH